MTSHDPFDRPANDVSIERRGWLTRALALSAAPASALVGCAAPDAQPARPGGGSTLDRADLGLLDRVSWGACASSAAAFSALGRDAWLAGQLRPAPDAPLPAAARAQIAAMSISTTPFETLVAEVDAARRDADAKARAAPDDAAKQAAQQAYQQLLSKVARESAQRSLLRALYSPAQLQEQLTWFWLNHFNVHQYKANLRVLVGDYEDRAIRPHALGRFRDLLVASATHPAMIRYLDNEQNAANRINENYAREVMELHTLGVDGGYSQRDVQELARVLTGLGLNFTDRSPAVRPALQDRYVRRGFTEFNPNRHDAGAKVVLGQGVSPRGLDEITGELSRLAAHPSTARFVSRKLAVHFAADDPPPALVDRMARTFVSSDGDIAAVLQAMFTAPDFAATLGRKFKDPMHYVVSAVRLAYDDRPVKNVQPMLGWLGRLGEAPYNRQTPDGYPLDAAAWSSPGQMAVRFEIARAISSGSAGLFRADGETADAPAFPRIANALYYGSIEPTLGEPTRRALDQATSPQEWNVFLLSSPEFMTR